MRKDLLSIVKIDQRSAVPVYRQIVHSIRKSIELGILGLNDTLPSVNSIAAEFGLARGSVFSAYNDLRASGIIDSVPGKGYFITSTSTAQKQKVFLLLDDFTAARAEIYQCIRETMGHESLVEVFFHHDDVKRFQALIREKAAYYNVFVLLPLSEYDSDFMNTDKNKPDQVSGNNSVIAGWHTVANGEGIAANSAVTKGETISTLLSSLDPKNVLILSGDFTGSTHNFEHTNNVARTMNELPEKLTKYFL